MDDMQIQQRRMSAMPNQFADPCLGVYGATKRGAFSYTVSRLTGIGGWDKVLTTHDRERALTVFGSLPEDGRWLVMRDAVNDAILGQTGRNQNVLIPACKAALDALQDSQARFTAKRTRKNRAARDAALMAFEQLESMCFVPPESRFPDKSKRFDFVKCQRIECKD